MRPFLALEAHTDRPRAESIANALSVLGAGGGFVLGTEQLGGLAVVFRIELPRSAALTLGERLAAHGIVLDAASRAAIEASTQDTLVGSLHLRFFAREPDLKIVIPKVPG